MNNNFFNPPYICVFQHLCLFACVNKIGSKVGAYQIHHQHVNITRVHSLLQNIHIWLTIDPNARVSNSHKHGKHA